MLSTKNRGKISWKWLVLEKTVHQKSVCIKIQSMRNRVGRVHKNSFYLANNQTFRNGERLCLF